MVALRCISRHTAQPFLQFRLLFAKASYPLSSNPYLNGPNHFLVSLVSALMLLILHVSGGLQIWNLTPSDVLINCRPHFGLFHSAWFTPSIIDYLGAVFSLVYSLPKSTRSESVSPCAPAPFNGNPNRSMDSQSSPSRCGLELL